MSLIGKLTLLFVLIFGCSFYYFVSHEKEATTKQYREATEEPIVDMAYLLAALVAEHYETDEMLVPPRLRDAFSSAAHEVLEARIYDLRKDGVDARVIISDPTGIVRFDSSGQLAEGSPYGPWRDFSLAIVGGYGARTSWDEELGCSTMYISAPIKASDFIAGVLTVAKPNCTANRLIEVAQRNTAIFGTITFGAALGVALLAGILVNRPLVRLISYARSIRDGKSVPLPKLPKGEMRTLGTALEEMRDALEGKQYIEQYVRTLSHELKSPITAIRGSSELLEEEIPQEQRLRFITNIRTEARRMESLVSKLMTLSTVQSSRLSAFDEKVEVLPLVNEIIDELKPRTDVAEVNLKLENPIQFGITGNALWLREAISNLVQNAIEFSPSKGSVVIALGRSDQIVSIEIRDEGPGIPEWALPKVFDRFFSLPRPASQKKSSGLGLSLAREIVEKHRGWLEISNREGGGLSARIVLPV